MMSSMEIDSVKKLPNNETEILFPPGPAGFALEPVVRNGTRAIGATVTAFLPTSDRDVNLYRNSSPYPYPKTKSNFGDLASQHLTIGSVMQEIDGECVRNKSFDCIMTILHGKSHEYRRILFKDVATSWLSGKPPIQPTVELQNQFNEEIEFSSFQNDVVSNQPTGAAGQEDFTDSESEGSDEEPMNLSSVELSEGQSRHQVSPNKNMVSDEQAEVLSENMDPLNSPSNFESQSPKTTISRTSPPVTASKKSPQVLLLEDWLTSPADAKNPFIASNPSNSMDGDSFSPRVTAKALFKDQRSISGEMEGSMQSVDLTPPQLSITASEECTPEGGDRGGNVFEAFVDEPSPVNSLSIASSIGTSCSSPVGSCVRCGNGQMSALEEMVDALLTEKLSQAEEMERKEVMHCRSLKHASERELELEAVLAEQSEAMETLQLQVNILEEGMQDFSNMSESHHSDVTAMHATIMEQRDELEQFRATAEEGESTKEELDRKVATLEMELTAIKQKFEQAEVKLAGNERVMRRDAEELSVAKRMAIGSCVSNRNIETVEEENRQLKLKVEILLYATVSRARVMNSSVAEADEEEDMEESLTTDEVASSSYSSSAGPSPESAISPSTPLKTHCPKVVASPLVFDTNSYLESLIMDAEEEEEATEVEAAAAEVVASPSPSFKIQSRAFTPRTPSEKMKSLQEMVDALLTQKMQFLEQEARLKDEIKDLEYTVKALAEDARCDEKALEQALLDVGEAQEQSEEYKESLVDMESEYISKVTKLQSDLKEALQAEDVIVSVRAECDEKVMKLEEELQEMRNAVLEITQDDVSEVGSLEDDEEEGVDEVEDAEEDDAIISTDSSAHSLTSNILNICGAIDRNDLISRSPAGMLSVAAHMESIGRRFNAEENFANPSTPSNKQAQSALRIWRKGQVDSPCTALTPLKCSTPLRAMLTPQTSNVTPPAAAHRQLIRTPLTAVRSNKDITSYNRANWSTGARPKESNGEKYWLLEANMSHKRLGEVRQQLALESESKLVLSRQFTDTSKQLMESNKLRALRDIELVEVHSQLNLLQQRIKDSEMAQAQEDIDDNYSVTMDKIHEVEEDVAVADLMQCGDDIYSFDMTRESAFSSICEEEEVSMSALTVDVSNRSMDKARLQMQVDFLKNQVVRARRSIERQRQRTAEAQAETAIHAKLQNQHTLEDRSRSQRIDERALIAAEAAATAAAAAERAVTAVMNMANERQQAFTNMKNASIEVEACRQECQDFKTQHEATSLLEDAEMKLGSLKSEADNATVELKATKTELNNALSAIESEKQSQAERQKRRAKELAFKKKKWLSDVENAKNSTTTTAIVTANENATTATSNQTQAKVGSMGATIVKIDEQKELNEKRIEEIESKLNKPHLVQHSKRWEQALKLQAEHHTANMKMLTAYKQQALELSNAQSQVDSLKARIAEAEGSDSSELVITLRAQLQAALQAKQLAEGKLEAAAEEYFKKDKEVEDSMTNVNKEYDLKLQQAEEREAEAQLKAQAADLAARTAQEAVLQAKREFHEANSSLKKELVESKESALNVEAAAADQRVALLDHSARLEEAVTALSTQLQEAETAVADAKRDGAPGAGGGDTEAMLTQLMEELVEVKKAKTESEELASESESARESMKSKVRELESEISRLTTQLTVTELEGKEAAEEEISSLMQELEELKRVSEQASVYAVEETQYQTALKSQVSTLEANIAYLSIELNQANEFIEIESNLRLGAESEAEQMRRQVMEASQHVNCLTAQLYESTEANKLARLAIVQAESETDEARTAVDLMSFKLSQSERKESELVSMVETAKHEVEVLVHEFETFSSQKEESEEKMKKEANNDYVELSDKVSQAQTELYELKEQLESALQARVECEAMLAEREVALRKAEEEMLSRAATSREYASCTVKERLELMEKNEELSNVIDTLCGELDELKNIYENKLNEVNSSSVNKEATMVQQQDDERNSHISQMKELEVTITLLREQLVQSQEATQVEIEQVWMKAETASQEMAHDVEIETKKEIGELELKLEESQNMLCEYEEHVVNSENKVKELESEISRLTTQLTVTELEGKEAAEEEIGCLRRELAQAQDASSQAVEYAEIEVEHKAILQTKVEELQLKISELNDRLVALQLAEVEAVQVSNAARMLDSVAADAKLEKLLTRVNKMELILEEAEAVEQGLIAELQNREMEIEEMDQDIDHVSMRAAGAEMMLEDVSTQLCNEVSERKQAEHALSVISEEVEELRCQFAQASSLGSAREVEMSSIRRKMSLEMVGSIAMAATQVGMCAASAKVAEIRTLKIEENQESLSSIVTHTESMAIGQVARLETQVKETQRIVTVRDSKIRELQASLSKASAERQKAEAELSRAVEMHETRMSALKKELVRAEESQQERDNRDRILHVTPKRISHVTAVAPEPVAQAVVVQPSEEQAVTVVAPVAPVEVQSVKKVTPRLSSGRKGRDVEKDTFALREANKKLHEHVQQGRSALAAVSAMRARRQAASRAASAEKPPPAQATVTASQPATSSLSSASVATPSRLAARLAEKSKTSVVIPSSTPKQLSVGTPIRATEVVEDKENIRAVENSAVLGKKTPSRLLRRLSLLSPTESASKKSVKTPKSQRRIRTPLRDSLVL